MAKLGQSPSARSLRQRAHVLERGAGEGPDCARIEEDRPSELVIDLSGLEFIDSTGLRLLLDTIDRAQDHGMMLRFLRGSDAVTRLLGLTEIDERMRFLD
jgi:anti-anti-sigma factor